MHRNTLLVEASVDKMTCGSLLMYETKSLYQNLAFVHDRDATCTEVCTIMKRRGEYLGRHRRVRGSSSDSKYDQTCFLGISD